jgi:hypothetical protein
VLHISLPRWGWGLALRGLEEASNGGPLLPFLSPFGVHGAGLGPYISEITSNTLHLNLFFHTLYPGPSLFPCPLPPINSHIGWTVHPRTRRFTLSCQSACPLLCVLRVLCVLCVPLLPLRRCFVGPHWGMGPNSASPPLPSEAMRYLKSSFALMGEHNP